jgi:selenium-binding protein 1
MTSEHDAHSGPGFATPADAMRAPREEVVYVAALHTGTGVEEPDFLATVDVDPGSGTYGSIVARTPMPASATSCTTTAGRPARARSTAASWSGAT